MDNLLKLQCKNCGSPIGYDIENQTYRCPNCGEITGIKEITNENIKWRRMNINDRKRIETEKQLLNCPNCGASILFLEGEESKICDFCGSRLIRDEFEKSVDFPEYVIPFVLTREEAEKRLRDWAEKPCNQKTKEVELIRNQGYRLTGYYLPYKLVRGPIHGCVSRQQSWRKYNCRGFLEGALISTSRQMNNKLLNAIEPFDISKLVPFEHGYIAGYKVRMPDISPAKTKRRAMKEAAEIFLPDAQKTLHTSGIRVNIDSDDLLEIPLLLPVYVLNFQNLMVVVNGQTGRIAVTSENKKKQSKLWCLEPILLTVLFTIIFGIYIKFHVPSMILFALIISFIMFIGYGNGKYTIVNYIIRQSENSNAMRDKGILYLSEGKNVLKNPLSNKPVFTEKINGTDTAVNIKFYSFGRLLDISLRIITMVLLPYLIAILLSVINGKPILALNPKYGSAWYVLSIMWAFLYLIVGIRQDVYNYPIIYEKKSGKRISKRSELKLSILRSFGFIGEKRLKKTELAKDEKKQLTWMVFFIIFILIGSVIAIMF